MYVVFLIVKLFLFIIFFVESEVEEPEDKDKEETESSAAAVDPISKYKALLLDIENNESKKKNRGLEMEITWGLGMKEKTEQMVKKKLSKGMNHFTFMSAFLIILYLTLNREAVLFFFNLWIFFYSSDYKHYLILGDKLTPFEELVEKRKDKKKAKKLERKKQIKKEKEGGGDEDGFSSDDIPSDVDMNDSYFAEEFDNPEFKANKKSKKKNSKHHKESDSEDEEELRKRAELELLLDDDDGKEHFSLKKIQDAENETKSKKKRKHKEKMKHKVHDKGAVPDGFEIDVADQRFSALYTSHHYNIDPTDSNFKKTKAMDTLIQEKLKRRPAEISDESTQSKKPKKDAAMGVLIKSIKRKALNASCKWYFCTLIIYEICNCTEIYLKYFCKALKIKTTSEKLNFLSVFCVTSCKYQSTLGQTTIQNRNIELSLAVFSDQSLKSGTCFLTYLPPFPLHKILQSGMP